MAKDVSKLKIVNDNTEYLFKDLQARNNISSLLGSGILTSQTQNTFFAAPSNKDGLPQFRKITASDLPILNQDTTGIASYAKGLIGKDTSGNYFDTSNSNVIIAEWNAKSDNRWYLKAAETYECRVDYATTSGKVKGALKFGSKSFNGSLDVVLLGSDLGSVDLTSEQTITGQKTFSGETYLDSLNANTGLISGNLRVVNGIFGNLTGNVTGNLLGNASTTTKLQTARTLTIGSTEKSFDGSSNVSWTLSEIGAAASSHTHSYLPLSGGTITGSLTFANGTWNVVGDDAAIGDYNVAGSLGLKSINNNIPSIGFHNSSNTLLGTLKCDAGTLKWNTNTIWNAGNDGSGSGLDADTVDGEHASAFAHVGKHNNLIADGNEFTFVPSGFSGTVWFNYRTAGGKNGNITEYRFGNGAGGELGTAIHSGNYNSYSPTLTGTGASGTWDINISGNSITATSLGSGVLKYMCSLYATNTYNAYKITTDWHKSHNAMPTINIRGYAYGNVRTIDCDIVMYHYDNVACNYSITNKGSYPIKVWQAIENDVQVFYINPGEYFGMFNVFVYGGMSTNTFSNWSMTTVDAVSGTEIPQEPIATSITGNATTATNITWSGVTNKPNLVNSFGTKTGDITIRGGQTNNGSVNLVMSNNELQASIVGLGSNAYTSTAYLPLAGGTLNSNADIVWRDRGAWGDSSATYPYSYGGLYWTGTSDSIKIYGKEEQSDLLNLWITFGDDSGHAIKIDDCGNVYTVYHTGNLSPMTTSHPANSITKTNIDNWNAVHTWYTTATASDTTNTIDTWKEIEAFVSSFKKGDNLATYLANNYLAKSGGTMSGTLIISGVSTSSWTEGIRINNATNGWSTLTLGGTANSGTGSDVWSLHTYNSNFYINNNGSNAQQATRLWGHSNGYTIGNTSISANTLAVGGTFRATSSIIGDTSISAGTTVTAATSVTSTAGDFYVGGTSGSRCHIKMDTTNKCIKFIFD